MSNLHPVFQTILKAHGLAADRSGRRKEQVRWPQVDERRTNEGRRFADVKPADPIDDERPYSPCQWADVPTSGFL